MKANISRFVFLGLVRETDSSSQCQISDALWVVFMRMNQGIDDDSYNDDHGVECSNKKDYGVKKGYQRNVTAVCITIRQFLLVSSDTAVYMLLKHIHRTLYAAAAISRTHLDLTLSDVYHEKKRKYHENDIKHPGDQCNRNDNCNDKNAILLEGLLRVLPLRKLLEYYSHQKNNEGVNNEVKTRNNTNYDNNDSSDKSGNERNDILLLLESLIEYAGVALSPTSPSTSTSTNHSTEAVALPSPSCLHINLGLSIIGALNNKNKSNANTHNSNLSIKNPKFTIMKYICVLSKYLNGMYKKYSKKANLYIDLFKIENILQCFLSLLESFSSSLTMNALKCPEDKDDSNDTKKQLDGIKSEKKTTQSSQNSYRNTNPNGGNMYERVALTSEDIQQLLVVTAVISDMCSLLVTELVLNSDMNRKNIKIENGGQNNGNSFENNRNSSPFKIHHLQLITRCIQSQCGYIRLISKNSNISPQTFEKLQINFFKLTTNMIKISQKLDEYYLININTRHLNRNNDGKPNNISMNLEKKIEVAVMWRVVISCLLDFASLLPSQFKTKIPSLVPPEVHVSKYLYVCYYAY